MKNIAAIQYPLIWIVNVGGERQPQAQKNKACKKLSRLTKMRDFLLAHYLEVYKYELKYALLNGETELEMKGLLGVHVDDIQFLNFHFYKKSFTEVYVDAFFRVEMTAYIRNNGYEQCKAIVCDYLVRGCYDFKDYRANLFQGIMPISRAYPLDYTPLDDYLVPKYSVEDLDNAAEEVLREGCRAVINGKVNLKHLGKLLDMPINKTGFARKTEGGCFYWRDTFERLYTVDGKLISTKVPANMILIERSASSREQKGHAAHEIAHGTQHSLFYFLQEKYHEDLKEHYGDNLPEWLPFTKEEQQALNRVERQADQIGFRIIVPEDSAREISDNLLEKYSCVEDIRQKLIHVVDDFAEYFDISEIAARNRLIDIGVVQAKGVYDIVDKKIVPAYIPPDDMKPYQTYTISRDELLKLYHENTRLRVLLDNGILVFAENHVVYNNEQFVHYDKRKKCGVLTDEARKNIGKCCLPFTLRASEAEYDYQFGVLKRTIKQGKRRNPTLSDEDIDQFMWSIEQDDDLPVRRKGLGAAFDKYITEKGWSNRTLADTEHFTEDRIKEMRGGYGRKVTAEEIVLFGAIVNLTYDQMIEMMTIGGSHLPTNRRGTIINKLIRQYEGATIEFYNDAMKRMKQPPINSNIDDEDWE